MTYSILGSGNIGSALARQFSRKGISVAIANPRGPDSLQRLKKELGEHIVPQTIEAALTASTVILAAPFTAVSAIARNSCNWKGKIVVDATNGQFRLTISDNGRGFSVRRAKDGSGAMSMGVGIPAMRARLKQLGGTLEIRSDPETPHAGTTLCAVFPQHVEAKRRKRRSALQS